MSHLSAPEYELFLDCVRELHSFGDLPALRSWLLDTALPKLIPSDWLSYNEVDLVNPVNTLAIVKPEENDFFPRLFQRFSEVAYQHPLISRQLQSPDFPVHKISDFLTQEAYHQLELYQDVYRPMGVEYQIAATVKLEPDRITAFALSRQRCDYTERDRSILEMLRPHLVVAFNHLALAQERQTIMEATTLALNELSSATLILDSQGRVLYHTGPGLKWIGATQPGVLPAKISAWLNEAPNGHRPLTWVTETRPIRIRAVPTNNRERRLLVLTQEPEPAPAAATPNHHGLSQREWEVARWISSGKTNAEIAAILSISPRTVHKHVEHMFAKLGVETRMALALKLRD